jgi:hypothetical protein
MPQGPIAVAGANMIAQGAKSRLNISDISVETIVQEVEKALKPSNVIPLARGAAQAQRATHDSRL